ncbi:hypothetical protein, partial [Shewanella algae]|uniref:hypothetical protein n=1 Tax=Shewanella algae TaxID=38313 RepID=UPI00197DF984
RLSELRWAYVPGFLLPAAGDFSIELQSLNTCIPHIRPLGLPCRPKCKIGGKQRVKEAGQARQ